MSNSKRIQQVLTFQVDEEKRLDVFLANAYPEFSRSYIQTIIEEGYVYVDFKEVTKPSKKLKPGQTVTLYVPEPEPISVEPEDIPLDIVYEDEDLLLVVKPCGLVVHPSPGYTRGTLVNALLYHVKNLSSIGGYQRPGIVHRLDKNTAGLMVIAKNDLAHRKLADDFKERKVLKFYKALVSGIVKQDYGIIEYPIQRHKEERKKFTISEEGKYAKTEFWVKQRFNNSKVSLLDVRIHTGRTHQIRVHLSSIGYPILGDRTYGFKSSSLPKDLLSLIGECHMLVSYRLAFKHPTKGAFMDFSIEDPEPFKSVLSYLEKYGSFHF